MPEELRRYLSLPKRATRQKRESAVDENGNGVMGYARNEEEPRLSPAMNSTSVAMTSAMYTSATLPTANPEHARRRRDDKPKTTSVEANDDDDDSDDDDSDDDEKHNSTSTRRSTTYTSKATSIPITLTTTSSPSLPTAEGVSDGGISSATEVLSAQQHAHSKKAEAALLGTIFGGTLPYVPD